MSPSVRVKICGLTKPADIKAAAGAGAAYGGFVFFEKSPRHLSIVQARELAVTAPPGLAKVALTVNAEDAFFDEMLAQVPIDIVQLQGKETPERVAEVKSRTGLPVMKAVGVASAEDLPALNAYAQVADILLVDAKPPNDAALPGGNGGTFDWSLIAGRRWPIPWMLAGGLHAGNVAQAVRSTGATQVDLSSGVESAPGQKDPALIQAFLDAVAEI